MTKNLRDHRVWTNTELEEDPQGYLAAQEAQRENSAASEQKEREATDFARFEEAFVKAGGTRSGARAAYEARKNEQAAEATRAADEEARATTGVATMRTL